MAKKLRWGVIGACGIAKRRTIPEGIIPAKNAKLVAVMDVDQEGAKAAAKQFKAKCCATEQELLARKDVDAIYVATPSFLHMKQVIMAAKARKHVLCEKPLANTAPEIKKMIAACKKARVKLGVGFMMRFNVYHQAILRMLRKKQLGNPVYARGQMSCWYPPMKGNWRQSWKLGGGGPMVDMGSHVVDVLEMLFGKAKSVMALTANRAHKYEVEDTAIALLEFKGGLSAVVDVSFAVPDETGEFVLEVYGAKGAVKGAYSLAQGPGGDFRLCLLGGVKGYDAQQENKAKGGFQPWSLKTKNTYQSEIEAFSDAVLNNKPVPVPAADGLWSHKVMEAIYKSAKTGKKVALR
jgi:predicted dehydrogenase